MRIQLYGDRILLGTTWKESRILVEDGRFRSMDERIPQLGVEQVDLSGLTVLPGLIDSHIHGYAGYDSMDADPEGLNAMSKELLKAGVTAFLPTTMTAKAESLLPALSVIGDLCGRSEGAKILGAFAEGPFITAEHRGAQPLEAIVPPSTDLLEQMIAASKGSLKKLILAPECPAAADFCRACRERGLVVALGHSSATEEQSNACIEAGATVAVHTFNGMKPLHHREAGLLGSILTNDSLFAELIFDTIHVHPTAAKVLLRCKGRENIILVSDCMRAGGLEDNQYLLGDTLCIVRDGIARTTEGNLAGSTLRLLDAVKYAVEQLGLPLEQAVRMASENPARSLGLFRQVGSISKGKAADLIAIDDNYQVRFAMVDGQVRLDCR